MLIWEASAINRLIRSGMSLWEGSPGKTLNCPLLIKWIWTWICFRKVLQDKCVGVVASFFPLQCWCLLLHASSVLYFWRFFDFAVFYWQFFPTARACKAKQRADKTTDAGQKTESIFHISDRKASICHRPLCFSDIERVSKTYVLFVLRHALVTRDLIKTCCLWLEPLQSAITHHYLWPLQPLEQ